MDDLAAAIGQAGPLVFPICIRAAAIRAADWPGDQDGELLRPESDLPPAGLGRAAPSDPKHISCRIKDWGREE